VCPRPASERPSAEIQQIPGAQVGALGRCVRADLGQHHIAALAGEFDAEHAPLAGEDAGVDVTEPMALDTSRKRGAHHR
jgi:hypothetical protein